MRRAQVRARLLTGRWATHLVWCRISDFDYEAYSSHRGQWVQFWSPKSELSKWIDPLRRHRVVTCADCWPRSKCSWRGLYRKEGQIQLSVWANIIRSRQRASYIQSAWARTDAKLWGSITRALSWVNKWPSRTVNSWRSNRLWCRVCSHTYLERQLRSY